MRILKIIHTMGHGGAENIFRWLAWRLRKEGIEVIAGIPLNNNPSNKENWITPALEELGIPYEHFDKTGSGFKLLKSLYCLIKKVQPDIVHSHLLDSNFYSAIVCRSMNIPHVCTEHGDISFKSAPSIRIKFALLSLFTHSIICVSEAVRRRAARIAVFSSKLGLIYNGIVLSEGAGSTFRQEFGIPGESLLIGNVGNLYPVKGQQYLIHAFARFLEPFPGSYLVLVGRGDEKKSLEELRARLGIPSNRVIFTGFRADVGNILNALDIYVQPSLSEGLPVSLLEAMSIGIPVIATDVGGVAEILGKGEHGLLISPESENDIYMSLMNIAQNIKVFKEKAITSKMMVREKFSLDTMVYQHIALYERVLKN